MASPFYRPSSFSPAPASSGPTGQFSGSTELSYGGLAAGAETGVGTVNGGAEMSVEEAAHAAATKASAEAASLSQAAHPGNAALTQATVGNSAIGQSAAGNAAIGQSAVGHAAIGQSAIGHAAIGQAAIGHAALAQAALVPGAEQAVSPLIQLIMRLPGAVGLTHSFFEFLSNMFLGGGHNLIGAMDPSMFHLDHLVGHLADQVSNLVHAGENFTLSIAHAPGADGSMLNSLSPTIGGGHDLFSASGVSEHFVQNPANIGAGPDVAHAQFENAPMSEGALAGPSVSHTTGSNFLAGNQRLFSDMPAGSGRFTSITSNTSVPVTSSAVPTSTAGTSLGQEAMQMPQATQSAISQPAATEAVSQPSSSYSNFSNYGSNNNLIASDSPVYRPTTGGYFNQGAPSADVGSDVTPLKAQQLTFEDMHKGIVGDQGKKLIEHIAGKSSTTKHVIDYVGHQAKGPLHTATTSRVMDGVSHHSVGKAYSSASESTAHAANHAHAAHHAQPAHHAKHVDIAQKPAQTNTSDAQSTQTAQQTTDAQSAQQAPTDGSQSAAVAQDAAATDQTGIAQAGDHAANYMVHKGDSLWNIAQRQLGDGNRWSEIYRMNSDVLGKNPDLIFSGTELKLPGADSLATDATKYMVKPGDNLWNIAKNNLGNATKWSDIYKANAGVIGSNPSLILPGQQLNLNPTVAQMPSVNATPVAQAPAPTAGGMDATQAAAPETSMQTTGMEPQPAMAPMEQPNVSMMQPAAPTGVIQAVTQHEMPVGPGAAGAATLPPANNSVVSSSIAPDLSFLSKKPGT